MKNNNSKSESYIVRQAEGIIDKYLEARELSKVKKYYRLKEKYERLKILTGASLAIFIIGMLLNIFLK